MEEKLQFLFLQIIIWRHDHTCIRKVNVYIQFKQAKYIAQH